MPHRSGDTPLCGLDGVQGADDRFAHVRQALRVSVGGWNWSAVTNSCEDLDLGIERHHGHLDPPRCQRVPPILVRALEVQSPSYRAATVSLPIQPEGSNNKTHGQRGLALVREFNRLSETGAHSCFCLDRFSGNRIAFPRRSRKNPR